MRLDLGLDYDLPELPRRREIAPPKDIRPPTEIAIERERQSDPVLKRLESLHERAADYRLNHHPVKRERDERERNHSVHVPDRNHERAISHPPDDRRPPRHRLSHDLPGIQLRPEEYKLLLEAGRFRVLRTDDVRDTIYNGRKKPLENDLVYLRSKALIETHSINLRRDGRRKIERAEVVVLTKQGRDIAHHSDELLSGQKLYAGLVKPREAEHDSQIYRAYRKEWEKIEQAGGRNPRVLLDFELKAQIQKQIYAARKTDPDRDIDEIKQQTAKQHQLPYLNHQIQVPDARIEYELGEGSRTAFADIEVVTAAYHQGHLRAKAQAGFHLYAGSDRTSITARIEHDHDLMQGILDL